MLRSAFVFLVLALIAAVLGYGSPGHSLGIARTLFYVFVVLFGISFAAGLRGSPRSTA